MEFQQQSYLPIYLQEHYQLIHKKTDVGAYSGIQSLVGEDLNRIHDSFFYQDYSYEVRIGESLATYLNELKKQSTHQVLLHLVK